eukprot:4706564-Prymnesium_polylepis.1
MPYLGQRSISPQSGQPHTYARLEWDVDDTEEAELRRLEEGSGDGAGNGLPTSSCAASRGS